MLPIWLLYFMPLFIVPNYLLKLGMVGIAVYIAHKCIFRLHIPARSALECWGLAILAELMGLSVFFVLERTLPAAFYDRHDALWGALALLLTSAVDLLWNVTIAFHEIDTGPRRLLVALLVTAATAPWFFLWPQ